jgi:hypothetical protein
MIDFKTFGLKDRALKELTNIKAHATPEEWNRLVNNLDFMDAKSFSLCVYGLLTGNCFNPRAVELIKKCADAPFFCSFDIEAGDYPKLEAKEDLSALQRRHYTCLEFYLFRNTHEVQKMIVQLNNQQSSL